MSERKDFDVTAVGEVLLRLSVPAGERIEAAASFSASVAGAECNVLSALAALGRKCGLVSALPANSLGRLVVRQLRASSVDVERMIYIDGGRLGTYFVEFARPPRSVEVIYDRTNSCAADLETARINWAYVTGARIIHLSGITPALSQRCLALTQDARHRAQKSGVPVSFDVNYRESLWSPADARDALEPLIREAEILFCSQRDAARLFEISGESVDVARELGEITAASTVVVSSGSAGATLWRRDSGSIMIGAPRVEITDRLGAGDALAAGVIDGWLEGDVAVGLRRGVALAALALTQHRDMLLTTRSELEAIVDLERDVEVRR